MPWIAFLANGLWVMVIGLLGPSIPSIIVEFDFEPYGTRAVSPKYIIFSFGSIDNIFFTTVNPPIPESKTPIGAVLLKNCKTFDSPIIVLQSRWSVLM